MITLENPVLNQPLVTTRPPEHAAANIQPLVSENREHLGDSPSFSSDFQTLPPRGHLLPRVFLHSALLYLPLTVLSFTLALNPRSRDVQHYDGTAAVAASSQPSLLRPCQPFPDSPYPYPTFSVNGFHRRGPHSLGCSSPFLPLSRFLSVFLLPFLRS